MRWLVIIAVALLAGCSSRSPGDASAEAAVRSALDVLAAGIDSSDPVLASEPVGQHFFMGGNVSARYTVDWDPNESAPAVGRFRTFFDTAFTRLANARQHFTVGAIDINGELAAVTVQSRFDAVRTDRTPAENVTYDTADYMLFQLQNSSWRLVRWDEQPAPSS